MRIPFRCARAGVRRSCACLFCLLFALALLAGVLGGVVGTGSSMVLLPALVFFYGPRVAVPVMAVAAVMGNVGRVLAWWRRIDWPPVVAYALPGIPAAVLGAHTLLTIPPRVVDGCLAAFFVAVGSAASVRGAGAWRVRLWHMVIAGAVVGFLTGMILSTGPAQRADLHRVRVDRRRVPRLRGRQRPACSTSASWRRSRAPGRSARTSSPAASSSESAVMAGSFLARRILRDVPAQRYDLLIDVVLVAAALGMGVSALT